MNTQEFRNSIKAAHGVGTPILCLRTPDPASAMGHVRETLNGKADKFALIAYDYVNGVYGKNEVGRSVVLSLWKDSPPESSSDMLAACVQAVSRETLPDDTIVFFMNAHKAWDQPTTLQAIWNVRDVFKENGQMLVLLTSRGALLPVELANDVLVLDEPLPSAAEIEVIIDATVKAATLSAKVGKEARARAVDALLGLPAYPAEQALSMSLTKDGVDCPALWTRKRQTIEQTRGLSVHRGTEKMEDVRGCDSLVAYMKALMTGEDPPRGIVFIDEINDAFAGTDTDTSGVKGDLQGTVLTHMVDHNADGVLLLGPAGTGKTLIGKATASVTGCLMIHMDLAGMQHGIVGSTGENIRAALAVIDATTQGRALWIGTCLLGGTIVQGGDGTLAPIDSFPSVSVASFNVDGSTSREIFSNKTVKTSRSLLKIESSAPTLFPTSDHTMYVWSPEGRAERSAGELKAGDWLMTPTSLPHGSKVFAPDLAWLLGYTAGDGNISANRLQWSEEDSFIVSELRRVSRSFFGEDLGVTPRKSQNSNIIYSQSGGPAVTCLRQYKEVCVTGTHDRSIPRAITTARAPAVAAFLSGLFDAEGSVSGKNLSISITSRILRDQTFMLLQRFGILATCDDKTPPAPRKPVYRVNMSGDNALAFCRLIGFRMPRKQKKGLALKPRPQNGKRGRTLSMVPVDWPTLLRIGYNARRHDPGSGNRLASLDRARLKRMRTAMLKDSLDVSILDTWLSFQWTKIKRVRKVEGEHRVYDITVPQNHNFCAGGLIVHNCNSTSNLQPQLKRRFRDGTFYVDFPDEAGREALWQFFQKKYGVSGDRPKDAGWSGAEIENCCRKARRMKMTLREAAGYIVPVSVSDAENIMRMRKDASGRYLSASKPGVYTYTEIAQPAATASGRKIRTLN